LDVESWDKMGLKVSNILSDITIQKFRCVVLFHLKKSMILQHDDWACCKIGLLLPQHRPAVPKLRRQANIAWMC